MKTDIAVIAGGDFAGCFRLSGVVDGDVARLVGQTADHLNELSQLEQAHPVLAQWTRAARSRLLRQRITLGASGAERLEFLDSIAQFYLAA